MDTLFEQYKFDPTAASKGWIYAIFTGFGTTLLSNMASLTIMLSADKKTKTQINRWLWCFFAMQVISSCLMQTMFLKILCPEIDPNGQTFNIGLWLIGATLAWKQMIA